MGVNPSDIIGIQGTDVVDDNPPLNSAERENDVATWESVLSGVGSGLIKAVGNTVSLGAELIDLGADTNKAAEVEAFFDKINPFDEAAEATTAGKVTEVISQLAIPGTAGFKAASAAVKGSKMASKAVKAKKNQKYFEKNNGLKALEKLKEAEKRYGKKRFIAGVAGGTAAEIAVFDEDIGTLGSAFDFGPTQLQDDELEGRENALQSLVNRTKFGLESIFLTGIISGVGATGKALAKHGDSLLYSNNQFLKFIDRYLGAPLRARGKAPGELFEIQRAAKGKQSADRAKAQRLINDLNLGIDNMFGKFRFSLTAAEKDTKQKIIDQIGNVVTSGKTEAQVVNRITKKKYKNYAEAMAEVKNKNFATQLGDIDDSQIRFKGFDKNEVKKLRDLMKGLPGQNKFGDLFKSMYDTRLFMDNIRNEFRMTDLVQRGMSEDYKNLVRNKIGSYFETTYAVTETKTLPKFLRYKPLQSTIETAKTELIRLSKTVPGLRKNYGASGMTELQAEQILDDVLNSKRILPAKAEDLLRGFVPKPVRPFEDPTAINVQFRNVDQLGQTDLQQAFVKNKNLREVLGESGDIRLKLFNTVETLTNYTTKNNILKNIAQAVENGQSAFGIVQKGDLAAGTLKAAPRALPIGFTSREAAKKVLGDSVDLENLRGVAPNADLPRKLGTEGFNPLKDMVFARPVAQAIEGLDKWYMGNNTVLKLYRNLVLFPKATSQIAKTVLSPITHVRNLLSATAFATANGVLPLIPTNLRDYSLFAKSFKDAYKNLSKTTLKENPELAKATYEDLLRLGVVNSNVKLGDLSGLLDDIGVTGNKLFEESGFRRFLGGFKKLYNKAEDLYTAEDDIWKMTNFASERGKLLRAFEGKIPLQTLEKGYFKNPYTGATETLNEHAARIVKNTVPNYDYVSGFIQNLRGLPFGNFVSFPAEIIRTGGNIIRQGIEELVDPTTGRISVNSPTFGIGMNRLLNASMTFAGLPYGLYEGAKALYNVSEEEMQALRRIVPYWSKNSTLLPTGRDEDGNLKYIDYSHANAYDTLIRPIQTVVNQVMSGEQDQTKIIGSLTQALTESAYEVTQPFVSEAIFFEAFNDILSRGGKARSGKTIYDQTDPIGDKVQKALGHILQTQVPGSWGQLQRILRATPLSETDIISQYDKYGNDYMLADEIYGIFGFRNIVAKPDKSMPYLVTAYRKTVDRTKGPVNSLVYRGGPVNPVDLVEAVIDANKRKFLLDRKFYNDLDALKTLGVNTPVFEKQLKRIRGQDQQAALRVGKFKPIRLTQQDIRQLTLTARELGLETNPYQSAAKQINKFLTDVSFISLNSNLEEQTDVDDLIQDIKDKVKGDSSFLPEVFKQPLQTDMPSSQIIGTTTNLPTFGGLTSTELALLSPEEQAIRLRSRGTQ